VKKLQELAELLRSYAMVTLLLPMQIVLGYAEYVLLALIIWWLA
jgi:hypothetical protein